jgi:hypothetical protein
MKASIHRASDSIEDSDGALQLTRRLSWRDSRQPPFGVVLIGLASHVHAIPAGRR